MSFRIVSIVVCVFSVFVLAACGKPKQCDGVTAAAAPIQELSTDGSAADLEKAVAQLEAAAAGTDNKEIQWLVASSRQLADHVKAGSQPGVQVPNYHDNKMMYLERFVDARRSVAALCQ